MVSEGLRAATDRPADGAPFSRTRQIARSTDTRLLLPCIEKTDDVSLTDRVSVRALFAEKLYKRSAAWFSPRKLSKLQMTFANGDSQVERVVGLLEPIDTENCEAVFFATIERPLVVIGVDEVGEVGPSMPCAEVLYCTLKAC